MHKSFLHNYALVRFLFIFLLLFRSFLSITFAYGDDIPAHGKWDDERYRSIHVLPPTLSIEGNILSVHFTEALNDLTIRIMDHAGNIMYENILSGETGDIINIPLDGIETDTYQAVLIHKLGWLVGEFEIK